MQQLILILHVLIAIAIIALVLLQHGKGADIGASFGSGASQTVFGSRGSIPFLMKVTAILAAVFFATSVGLTYLAHRSQRENNIMTLPNTSQAETTKQINFLPEAQPAKQLGTHR